MEQLRRNVILELFRAGIDSQTIVRVTRDGLADDVEIALTSHFPAVDTMIAPPSPLLKFGLIAGTCHLTASTLNGSRDVVRHIAAISDFLANRNMQELRRKVIIELVKNNNDAQTIICELWLLSFKMH